MGTSGTLLQLVSTEFLLLGQAGRSVRNWRLWSLDRPGQAILASVLFYRPERPKVGPTHIPRFSYLHKWSRVKIIILSWLL